MTSHNPQRRLKASAKALDVARGLAITGLAAAGLAMVATGCSSEPEPPVAAAPVVRNTPPPAPPKPTVKSIEQLMTELAIDERVRLPEAKAPATTEDRVAVLTFFDAFARGDADTLKPMLTLLDRIELDGMVETEAWRDTVTNISDVAVETGPGPYGEKCVLALFEVGDSFQPQLWYYKSEGGAYQFEAAATPPNVMDKLYGDDWIARWHELLEEEIALANQIDIDLDIPATDLDESEDNPGSTRTGDGTRPGLTPGGGPGGGRRPVGPKRKPPGSR